jgi:toxin HigB-1
MDIAFKKDLLRKCSNDHSYAQRKLGPIRAKKYLLRLQQMREAECLENLRHLPQIDVHELTADRKGQLACNLDHPYRLILEPAHDPIPSKEDGGLDWNQVTAVIVLGIEDYHHG